MNSFFFEDKDPRFTRLKPVLALRLLSKGLFYIRAMRRGVEKLEELELPMCIMVVHCSLPFSLVTRQTTYYITLKTMIFKEPRLNLLSRSSLY